MQKFRGGKSVGDKIKRRIHRREKLNKKNGSKAKDPYIRMGFQTLKIK